MADIKKAIFTGTCPKDEIEDIDIEIEYKGMILPRKETKYYKGTNLCGFKEQNNCNGVDCPIYNNAPKIKKKDEVY